jgi:two-component system, chemotaxis family, CheB/CheR fusion protein
VTPRRPKAERSSKTAATGGAPAAIADGRPGPTFDLAEPGAASGPETQAPSEPREEALTQFFRDLGAKPDEAASGRVDAEREADRVVLSRYAPAGVVVDARFSIVQFRGHTGPYLEPAPGDVSLDVLKMAREGLALDLRAALHKSRSTGATVNVSGIKLRDDAQDRAVSLEVIPLEASSDARAPGGGRWFLILFFQEPSEAPCLDGAASGPKPRARFAGPHAPAAAARDGSPVRAGAVQRDELARELAATKHYLQATIDEHDAVQEELESANEELESANEELHSINEDLVAAKEELQSNNQELTLLNDELGSRNAELKRVNHDLGSLLSSVDIPIVMLGSDLCIRRFTPQAERAWNLVAGDVGRPIGSIKPTIDAPDLEQLLTAAIDTFSARERVVQDAEGRWYSLRVRPCRTADNKVDGAVMVLVGITMGGPESPPKPPRDVDGGVERGVERGVDGGVDRGGELIEGEGR